MCKKYIVEKDQQINTLYVYLHYFSEKNVCKEIVFWYFYSVEVK